MSRPAFEVQIRNAVFQGGVLHAYIQEKILNLRALLEYKKEKRTTHL